MPSLVNGRAMNSYELDRGPARVNGLPHDRFDTSYRDDPYGREDMRRDEDVGYPRGGVRNGGPAFDRFNTDYLDQNSLSDFRSSEPRFELDHLATFAAGSRNGCIHAEDGLRKLRQMENTTGIWTMRCVLIVERGYLVILDNSTGEEIERFPIQFVQDPTAIFKNDPREIYNNLMLFTIGEDPKKRGMQADMHIFQSCRAPAQEIVDEILAAKGGQQRLYPVGGGGGGGSRIPPPPANPAPDPPNSTYDFNGMREYIDSRQYTNTESRQFNQTSYSQGGQFGGPIGQQRSFITRINNLREREDLEGGSNEILERDVQLLNHCFDDIEKFVSRLQQAAESFKELEKRKRERGAKNKKRQSGDGMLNARARPPPDRDFVDIFQKFKLSFNLLAKLKAHIHDPNAPELVHFLFTPLSLIYEASRDPYHGNQNLGDQAVAPVLTPEAKQLLLNCLTSKEIELWQALGKHWMTSRVEWNGHIPPYIPEFYDGWQPAAGVIDDLTSRAQQPMLPPGPDPMRSSVAMDDRHRNYNNVPRSFPDEDRYPEDFRRNRAEQSRSIEPLPPAGPMSRQEENAAYFDELKRSADAVIYEAGHDREGKNAKELTVQKGDILQVLDSSKNWWKLRNYKGATGFAPYTILKAVKTEDDLHMTNGGHPPSGRQPQSEASYHQDNNNKRAASRRGQDLEPPTEKPANFRHQIQREDSLRSSTAFTHSQRSSPALSRHADDVPHGGASTSNAYSLPIGRSQPPPAPEVPPKPASSKEVIKSNFDAESKSVIKGKTDDHSHYVRSKKVPPRQQRGYVLPPTEGVPNLTQNSPPAVVQQWLVNKNFSNSAQENFQGYHGQDMFQLRLKDLQALLSHEEAVRLNGLLTLQKKSSGYATRSSRELNEILKRRKEYLYSSSQGVDGHGHAGDTPADPPMLNLREQLVRQRSQLRSSTVEYNE